MTTITRGEIFLGERVLTLSKRFKIYKIDEDPGYKVVWGKGGVRVWGESSYDAKTIISAWDKASVTFDDSINNKAKEVFHIFKEETKFFEIENKKKSEKWKGDEEPSPFIY